MIRIDRLCEELKGIHMRLNVPMNTMTTFHIGGPAAIIAEPSSPEELLRALCAADSLEIPCHIMGNGSNTLVSDKGYLGLIIRVGDRMAGISCSGCKLRVGAGALLSSVAKAALSYGLMGLEWANGIPGTIGGAAAMNAGAYGGEMSQVITEITGLKQRMLTRVKPVKSDFSYRSSSFTPDEWVVSGVELTLERDDGFCARRMAEYAVRRRERQPLDSPSAGSIFKRPKGYYAGALIEQAGLKGARVGGAEVSQKHAGFIINKGGATCGDVLKLIELIQKRVYENSGVLLETEVKVI